ncbi:MAG: hypothetical protein JKY54_02850 [Flavobacteriales bacterium]|nr:hypothetical protein [Flavobacteriales bacterium]
MNAKKHNMKYIIMISIISLFTIGCNNVTQEKKKTNETKGFKNTLFEKGEYLTMSFFREVKKYKIEDVSKYPYLQLTQGKDTIYINMNTYKEYFKISKD